MSSLRERIDDSGVLLGPGAVEANVRDIVASRTIWPWPELWPSGRLPPAIAYLDHCTAASDRILMTWPAPEYYFFARRPFAAGHALLLPPRAFATSRDRDQMRAWLAPQRVPIVLINEERRGEFTTAYPDLAAYVAERYRAAGTFTIYDGATITVAVRNDLRATSRHEPDGWPCGFETGRE